MRTLACIDPVPAPDGTCQQTAWVEQAGFVQYLPTVEQANLVGGVFFLAYITLAVMQDLLSPSQDQE